MDIIKEVLQTTEPNSRQRKRAAVSLHALARFTGLDFDLKVQVLYGKTGPREVFAFPAEWYYEMSCQNVLLPRVNRDIKSFAQLGSKVTQYFR